MVNSMVEKVMEMNDKADTRAKDFPIVCVGGSAGDLDAYIRLLQNLPADMGVAIVIVNHITEMPTHLRRRVHAQAHIQASAAGPMSSPSSCAHSPATGTASWLP